MKRILWAAVMVAATLVPAAGWAQSASVLKPEEAKKMLPATVYYKGQQAPTEARNTWGIKFDDGGYLLITLVDNSGYSTGVAQKYQAWVAVEEPVTVGGKALGAGVYGAGFVDGKFVITDIGAHELLTADAINDQEMRRPMPLQILADQNGGFRVYAGRMYVVVKK